MPRLFCGLLLCVLAIGIPRSVGAADSLLINGSFEFGPPPFPVHDIDIPPGSVAVTGWIVTGAGIDLLEDPWDVFDGVRAIDLDGRSPGGIQQSFATTKSQVYKVTFDTAGNPEGEPTLKRFRVTVGPASHDYVFNSQGQTIDELKWRRMTFNFKADGSTATLSFTSLSDDGNAFGALIDNVSVIPVGHTNDSDTASDSTTP
jgi:choice-of-anchor C domain-containing protein